MNTTHLILPCLAGLALLGACGDGGGGPAVPAGETGDVPNATDAAPSSSNPPFGAGDPVPNATDAAPNSSDRPGGGAPDTPGAGNPVCTRICTRLTALACDVDDEVEADCAGFCASEILDGACGAERGALFDCVLSRGFCVDDAEEELGPGGALGACIPILESLSDCLDAEDPDPMPGPGDGQGP